MLLLTNIIDWSWWWILAFSIFIVTALNLFRNSANKYSLKKQKEKLIRNTINIKISKSIQNENIDLDDVKKSLKNLLYSPCDKHHNLVCPDCGKEPIWIRSENSIMRNNNNEYGAYCSIYYDYAICSICIQVIHCQFIKYRAWFGA